MSADGTSIDERPMPTLVGRQVERDNRRHERIRQAKRDFANMMMPILVLEGERASLPADAPRAVPLGLVVPNRLTRFFINHKQRSPKNMADIGGITWNELLAVLLDQPLCAYRPDEAYERCRVIARAEGLPIEGFN